MNASTLFLKYNTVGTPSFVMVLVIIIVLLSNKWFECAWTVTGPTV